MVPNEVRLGFPIGNDLAIYMPFIRATINLINVFTNILSWMTASLIKS